MYQPQLLKFENRSIYPTIMGHSSLIKVNNEYCLYTIGHVAKSIVNDPEGGYIFIPGLSTTMPIDRSNVCKLNLKSFHISIIVTIYTSQYNSLRNMKDLVKTLSMTQLLSVLSLIGLCFSFLYFYTGIHHDTKYRTTMYSIPLTKLEQLPVPELPIESASEAISYAITLPVFSSSLYETQNALGSATRWDVISQYSTKLSSWSVKFKSNGFVSSSCRASFKSDGILLDNHTFTCTYSK